MVLLFAIKEQKAGGERDSTCTDLIQRIGQNCHRIVVDRTMREMYLGRIAEQFRQPQYLTPAALFLANFVHNSAKFVIEDSEPPEIPATAVAAIPKEDHYIVRAALISHPIVVTDEERLRNRINEHSDALSLKALSPSEALGLAEDS